MPTDVVHSSLFGACSTSRTRASSSRPSRLRVCAPFATPKRFHSSSMHAQDIRFECRALTPWPRYVIANDLSPSAVAAMKRNVEINGLAGTEPATGGDLTKLENGSSRPKPPKVRVNEGDAW